MMENFQSLPGEKLHEGLTQKTVAASGAMFSFLMWCYLVWKLPREICVPHGADSWAWRSQQELEEVEASELKRINKSKNKPASDGLS